MMLRVLAVRARLLYRLAIVLASAARGIERFGAMVLASLALRMVAASEALFRASFRLAPLGTIRGRR